MIIPMVQIIVEWVFSLSIIWILELFFLNMVVPIIEDLLYKIEDVIIHEKRTFSEINH